MATTAEDRPQSVTAKASIRLAVFANAETAGYLSADNLTTAVRELHTLASELKSSPGFKAFYFVRTGATKTVFDTDENAKATFEKLFPRFREIVGSHTAGPPRVEPGEGLITQ